MKTRNATAINTDQIKKHPGTYVVLLLSLSSMVFFGVCSPQGPRGGLTGNAAHVASEEISAAQYSRAYTRYSEQMRQQYGESYDPATLKIASAVMEQLVNDRVMYLTAIDMGIYANEDEVVSYLDNIPAFLEKDQTFSEQRFRDFLRYNHYTESSFQEEIRRQLSVQKLRQYILETSFVSTPDVELNYLIGETKLKLDYIRIASSDLKVQVTEEDSKSFLKNPDSADKIKVWYESHKKDFLTPEQVNAQHLLVAFKGSQNAPSEVTRSKEDAQKRAEELLAEIEKTPAKLDDIIKANTDEPAGKESAGNLGLFTFETMVKEFSEAAFKLNSGELSQVVESPFGFHIIKVLAKVPQKNISIEEATPKIVTTLIEREKGPKLAQERAVTILSALKEKKDISALLGEHKLAWEQTSEFSFETRYIPGLGAKTDFLKAITSLKKQGDVYQDVVASNQNYFIFKLADIKKANLKDLNDERKESLASASSFSDAYAYLGEFEKNMRANFDTKGKIKINTQYLELDAPH